MDQNRIRNFSVIAHIDHGKSTLADRFLEMTGALQAREMEAQVLDAMDLERERGITIKAHPVRLHYTADDGQKYVLNLIDTPGPRRLLLRSDAVARRLRRRAAARRRLAGRRSADARQRLPRGREQPRDHPGHQQDRSAGRAARRGAAPDHRHHRPRRRSARCWRAPRWAPASPRSSRRSSQRLPPPAGDPDAPLKALIFDSWYDPYRGVVIVVRVIDGVLRPGMKIRLMAEGQDYESLQVGIFTPKADAGRRARRRRGRLSRRQHQEDQRRARSATPSPRPARPALEPFPGFKELKPMVFAGLLSGRRARVSGAARRAREAAAERRVVLLRAGDLGRARLRLPLRLPRPAAHGDRPGAARARVRHGPGHDRAGRAVPGDDDRRRGAGDRQPGEAARRRPDRR